MKYRIPIIVEIDLGEGVALEKPDESLPALTGDLWCVLDHFAGNMGCELANADIEGCERGWNCEVAFVLPEPATS